MGNALLYGEHRRARTDKDYQRADHERPFRIRRDWRVEKLSLRYLQQRRAYAPRATFFYESANRDDVHLRAITIKGRTAYHGRHAPSVAWRPAHAGAGIH